MVEDMATFIRDLNSLNSDTKAHAREQFASMWQTFNEKAVLASNSRPSAVGRYFGTAMYYLDQVLKDDTIVLPADKKEALLACKKELEMGHVRAVEVQNILDTVVF